MAGRLIKFPLKMKSGAEIRTIEELRECSEPETLIEYYLNGVLVRWLKAFHYDEEAENISKLDDETCKKLFEILHIDFSEEKLSRVNVGEIKENMEKKEAETKTSSEIPELDTTKEELKKKVDNMSEDEICDECLKIIDAFDYFDLGDYETLNKLNKEGMIIPKNKCIANVSIYKDRKQIMSNKDKIYDAMKNIIINKALNVDAMNIMDNMITIASSY